MYKPNNMRLKCHLLFCRMPDPDFSVNDVKMFVGKTSSIKFFFFN